jgi:hypothetical protein
MGEERGGGKGGVEEYVQVKLLASLLSKKKLWDRYT